MSYYAFILKLLRPYRKRLVVAIAVMLLLTVVSLLPPLIFAYLVDEVLSAGKWHLLTPLMLMMLVVPFLAVVLRSLGNYLVTVIGQRIIFDLRLMLYRKVHRLSCDYLNNTTTGKLMERLRGDVQQLQTILNQQTLLLIVQSTYGLIALGIMLWISWPLTVVCLVAIGLYYVNYDWFVRRIRVVQKRYRRHMDRLSGRAQEKLTGQVVVKSYGKERQESYDFLRSNFVTERVFHRFRKFNFYYGETSFWISSGTQMIVLLLGSYFVVLGGLTVGLLLAMRTYVVQLMTPITQLAELSNQLAQAKIALDRIHEELNAPSDYTNERGLRLPTIRGEVTFSNLCFEYEPNKPVLRYLNLHVQPGQNVALVGQTGCGKSTIFNLLYRFWEPQAGHLKIDGHEISQLDTNWYRRHLAIVPQDPIVFDTTIRDNVLYGARHASEEAIVESLEMAEFGRVLQRMPRGLDTLLGEEGVKLSVGEKQRLCIARAILANPAILLLDEATSSLDPQSEALIQVAMKRVMENRTSFIIAHRLSTIVDCDLIVVLDQGRVLEMGSHAELIHKEGGRYRHLFETQAGAAADIETMLA